MIPRRHENGEVPCNRCVGCAERREALSLAGEPDPQLAAGGIRVPVQAKEVSAER